MIDRNKRLIGKVKKKAEDFDLAEYVEAMVDATSDSEVFKAIPFVSTVTGVVKTYLQYKEGKFKKKVEIFTEAAGSFTDDEWDKFYTDLNDEGKEDDFVSELLEIIERVDEEQKAKIIGGIFRRLVKREVTYSQFEDQVQATIALQVMNIHFFMHGYHNEYILEESLGDVMTAQRVLKRKIELAFRTVNIGAQKQEQYIKVGYTLTAFGGAYLTTLHQVYKDKIQPDHLYAG
ncbi:hypothetical protein [Pseudomonas salmasensis]|uniref:hypothetical protein n=1 Tax=Pseudomonas salmasensis TaxID=2745514 RepID=UPI0016484442|nr:hypothetical protein [Pseudomonas salmasensis]QXH77437.1 hypothetical protein HU731_023870 [Pseudomonas salmasensis]